MTIDEDTSPYPPEPKPGIETSDVFTLRSAMGWLELGMPAEARKELQTLTPEVAQLPEVRGVQWSILAQEKNWAEAEELARDQVSDQPDNAANWINWAYALRRADGCGIRMAYDTLREAVDRFPKESTIPYNLACYCCRLEELEEAWRWLCLLYTSPSPRDRTRSRMPSSA